MKQLGFNLSLSKIDTISKFNLYNKNLILNLENLIIFSKLNVNDSNFMRDFFFLSKLFFFWFDRKISILQIIKDKKKSFNRGKRSLTFFFGCTLRKNILLKNINYIENIVFYLTKRIDGALKFKTNDFGFLYGFSNVNFLLGFKSESFFNFNVKINIFYNFFNRKKFLNMQQNKSFNKKIITFYEKVFF